MIGFNRRVQMEYDGSRYELPYDSKELKKNKFICFGFWVTYLALFIVAGCLNQDSSRTIWIAVPYFLIFLPLGFDLIGLYNLSYLKTGFNKTDLNASIIKIKNSTLAIMLISILNIILDGIFIVINFKDIILIKELAYMLLMILLIIDVVIFGKNYDRMFGGVTLSSNQ